MKTYTQTLLINSPPEKVFFYMDDINHTGMHMTKSSMPMFGSKLELKQVSINPTGLDATHRWFGRIMGFRMDFTVKVSKWLKDKEKIWETIGRPKLIIMAWYRMHLFLISKDGSTLVELSISYTKPKSFFYRILSFLLAGWYCKWCLQKMLEDSKKNLEGG